MAVKTHPNGDTKSKIYRNILNDGPTQEQLDAFERDALRIQAVHVTFHDSSISFFRNLFFKGLHESVNFNTPFNSKPKWLDVEKFNRGRKFALDNISGILLAEMMSLILLFGIEEHHGSLMFTRATDTPFKCFMRYTSTFKRLRSWYEEDLWSEKSNSARKHMAVVRYMHKKVHIAMSSTSKEKLKEKISLENLDELRTKFKLYQLIKEDAANFSPFPLEVLHTQGFPQIWFNQTAMSFVQWAFAGLVITYPKHFGIHQAKEEDLEGFMHLWRALGYTLGLKDEFNFFEGDLENVREKSKGVTYIIMSYLKNITPEWEFMSRCLVDGGNISMGGMLTLEGLVKYVFHVLNVETPKLDKRLTFRQYFHYYFMRFVFEYLMKIPFVPKLINYLMLKNIDSVQNVSPELLKRWESKEYFYLKK